MCGETPESCATTGMTTPAPTAGPVRRDRMGSNAAARSYPRVAGNSSEATLKKKRHRTQCLSPTNRTKVKMGQHSDAENKTEVIGPSLHDESTYPNSYEDPNQVPPYISPEYFEVPKEALVSFGYEMFEAFVRENNEGEELWIAFISTLRPYSIEEWPKRLTYTWCAFLQSREVHIYNGRKTPRGGTQATLT